MNHRNYEEQKLAYEREINKPMAAFDVNPFIITPDNRVVLARRIPSVQDGGKWSMPGGKVFDGERIENALKRMTLLKTGLVIELMFPTLNESLIGIYDNPGRDPRAHVVGVAFLCREVGGDIITGGNSGEVRAFSEEEVQDLELAFDHPEIIRDGYKLLRSKVTV